MSCEVEITNEFEDWWDSLSEAEHISIRASVTLLEEYGINLPYPHSSGVTNSKYSHMRELRVQHHGRPYRILYAFNPLRNAILLIGGDKTGNNRWYDQNIPIADELYKVHLQELKQEEDLNGKEI